MARVFIHHLSLLSAAAYQACHPTSAHAAPGTHRANCPLPTHSLLGHLQWAAVHVHTTTMCFYCAHHQSRRSQMCVRDKKCVAKIEWAGPVNTSVPRLGAHSGRRGTLVAIIHRHVCLQVIADSTHKTKPSKAGTAGDSRWYEQNSWQNSQADVIHQPSGGRPRQQHDWNAASTQVCVVLRVGGHKLICASMPPGTQKPVTIPSLHAHAHTTTYLFDVQLYSC